MRTRTKDPLAQNEELTRSPQYMISRVSNLSKAARIQGAAVEVQRCEAWKYWCMTKPQVHDVSCIGEMCRPDCPQLAKGITVTAAEVKDTFQLGTPLDSAPLELIPFWFWSSWEDYWGDEQAISCTCRILTPSHINPWIVILLLPPAAASVVSSILASPDIISWWSTMCM